MIARIWRGITSTGKSGPYLAYLTQVVLPDYQVAKGNRGVFIFREVKGELVYFLLLSLWSSYEWLVEFAGPHPELAKPSQEEQKFLVAAESVIAHYEVIELFHPGMSEKSL